MKILNLLDTVGNHVTKANVKSTLQTEIDYIENKLMPTIDKAKKTYPGELPTNYAPLNEFMEATKRKRKAKGLAGIEELMENYVKQAKGFVTVFDTIFDDNAILKDALTYRIVSLVQYTEVLAFVSRYVSRLVDGFTYHQFFLANANEQSQYSTYQRRMTEWLVRNRPSVVEALSIGQMKETQAVDKVMQTPDKIININEIDDDVKSAPFGMASLDPLGFGIITGKFSPIYLAQDMFNRLTHWINDDRKERLTSIELKLEYLKEVNAGKRDPRLEDKINRLESTKKKLYKKIAAYEEEDI